MHFRPWPTIVFCHFRVRERRWVRRTACTFHQSWCFTTHLIDAQLGQKTVGLVNAMIFYFCLNCCWCTSSEVLINPRKIVWFQKVVERESHSILSPWFFFSSVSWKKPRSRGVKPHPNWIFWLDWAELFYVSTEMWRYCLYEHVLWSIQVYVCKVSKGTSTVLPSWSIWAWNGFLFRCPLCRAPVFLSSFVSHL